MNLGLHLTFLPTKPLGQLPADSGVREIDCEFRTRLTPSGEGDYWWSYDRPSAEESAETLLSTFLEVGEPQYTRYDTTEKVAAMFSLQHLEEEPYPWGFGGITVQRAALAMARVHAHLDDAEAARRFAELGLQKLGGASSLREEFEVFLGAT